MKYNIIGGSTPAVTCELNPGEAMITQSGAMAWMSPNMSMETRAGGLGKAFGRLFSGESIFLNRYTAMGGPGQITFASSFPGSIIPYQVTPGKGIIVQKRGFLAMEKGLDLSVHFQKRLGAGLFGGEGFVMQKISGDGLVFIEIDGNCKEYTLAPGESIIVDTGYLAAMTDGCTLDVRTVKGAKNMLFGGEGFFNTVITGPGTVYLQSMPVYHTAQALMPYITVNTGSSGSKGININLGE